MKKKWIKKALNKKTKGALHRQLGISQYKTIPEGTLISISQLKIGEEYYNTWTGKWMRVTRLLKRRVQFALNVKR